MRLKLQKSVVLTTAPEFPGSLSGRMNLFKTKQFPRNNENTKFIVQYSSNICKVTEIQYTTFLLHQLLTFFELITFSASINNTPE